PPRGLRPRPGAIAGPPPRGGRARDRSLAQLPAARLRSMNGGCLRASLPTPYGYEERYGWTRAMVTSAGSGRTPPSQEQQPEPGRESRAHQHRQHMKHGQMQQLVRPAAESHHHERHAERRRPGQGGRPRAGKRPPSTQRNEEHNPGDDDQHRRPPEAELTQREENVRRPAPMDGLTELEDADERHRRDDDSHGEPTGPGT